MGLGMFDVMETLLPIFFVLVLGFIAFVILRNVGEYLKNNASEVIMMEAVVVSKRAHTSGGGEVHHSTQYFVTFQSKAGSRKELMVSGREYGMLVEGDSGVLTYQGTRYKGFEMGLQSQFDLD